MNVPTDFQNLIKLLIIGDSSVGKSNFLFQFIENKFTDTHIATIGFDFKSQKVTLPNSKQVVKLQIWDTAGQERYMSVNKNLFLRVQGMILMYDITNRETFEHISNWVENIKEICSSLPIVLVGNKCDMDELRIVTEEEGREIAKKYNMSFFEASGKTGINVKEAFYEISEQIIKGVQRKRMNTVSLMAKNKDKEERRVKGCC